MEINFQYEIGDDVMNVKDIVWEWNDDENKDADDFLQNDVYLMNDGTIIIEDSNGYEEIIPAEVVSELYKQLRQMHEDRSFVTLMREAEEERKDD